VDEEGKRLLAGMEMIELHTYKWMLKPYTHQLRGVKTLITHPYYGLWWKMRLGKTKCVIDTACELFEANLIDTLLVVAPAQVKDVWIDPTLGEIKTHDWSKARVHDYSKFGALFLPDGVPCYVAASVEFLRQAGPRGNFPMVDDLLSSICGRRVWFVFDEGSVLGNHKSGNSKAMIALRYADPIKRFTLLDGTPRGNSHLSYYNKFKMIDKKILGLSNFYQYQNHYSETVKVPHKWKQDKYGKRVPAQSHIEVIAEKNMDEFIARTSPHCEYLEQDVIDMPKKISVVLTAALDEKAWKVYCRMRDELVAEIDSGVCAVQHAAVKCVRLAQICAGFIGGVQEEMQMGLDAELCAHTGGALQEPTTKEIHDIPTKMLMGWLERRFEENENFKVVIWSRFVPEIERLSNIMYANLYRNGPSFGLLYGENKEGAQWLHPKSELKTGYVLIAQPQAAQYGLNLSKADTAVYLSQDYNRVTRAQSEDRIQAPDGRASSLLVDVLVTGPKGQRTITHDIVASVRGKEEAERRTAQSWKKVLLEV
jgi:hypothetical protein